MPTYEYRCPEGHESEDFVLKISDAKPEIVCPTCGAVAARRVSAGSGLLFKGSGFYITDYGKDGKKDLREKQNASAAKAGEGSGASSGAAGGSAAASAASPSASVSPAPSSGSTAGGKGGSGTSSAS